MGIGLYPPRSCKGVGKEGLSGHDPLEICVIFFGTVLYKILHLLIGLSSPLGGPLGGPLVGLRIGRCAGPLGMC